MAPDQRPSRHHKKSRTGCMTCKQRKVKCDERRPCCLNCDRYGSVCTYTENISTTAAPASSEPCVLPISPPSPLRLHSRADLSQQSISGFPQPISSSHLIYLELLFNYATLTSLTLSGDPLLRDIWRINVPRLGFSHEFVMRSIMALSALHISTHCSDRRQHMLDVAQAEHGAAIREMSALLPHSTAQNCSALYIGAVLTFFYAWAAPRQPGDFFLVSDSGVANWVFLMRGVRGIAEMWADELYRGPFRTMIRLGRERSEGAVSEALISSPWLSTREHVQLENLRHVVLQGATDASLSDLYNKSISRLEACFCSAMGYTNIAADGQSPDGPPLGKSSSGAPHAPLTSQIYSWLYRMEPDFIDQLQRKDQPSLVIFAHFCVLLKLLSGCWWMQGWPTHLLQEIWESLDEDHRLWMIWPTEELGWRR